MKRKMKKAVALAMTGVLSIGLLCGCGDSEKKISGESKNGSGVTLTLYGNGTDLAQPYMKKIFEMYEEASGNTIDVQGIDENNLEKVALTKFQTGDIPDIFVHNGGYSLEAYNPSANFVDFSDADWVSDIEDTVLPQAKRDGVVYGLPFWEAALSGMIYNKAIFEKYNIEVPKTQQEFDEVCQKLLDAGVQPIYMAVKDSWPMFCRFGMDAFMSEGNIIEKLNSNQTSFADMPEMKSLMNWYLDSAKKGYFGKSYITDTWDYGSEVLGTGEAAMMLAWDTWVARDYDSESFEYTAEDFGIMPTFMGTAEDGAFGGPICNLFLANKNSQHVEAAIDFINFAANPENYNKAFEGIYTAPCLKGQTTIKPTAQYEEVREWAAKVAKPSATNMEIIGYSDVDAGKCIQELLSGNVDVDGCLKMMDAARIKIAKAQQVKGF